LGKLAYTDNELSQQQRDADNKRLKEQFKEEYQELASLGGMEEIAISWLKAVG